MKLEIINSEDGLNDLYFRINNNFIRNGVRIRCFDEEDVLNCFGDKIYKKFLNSECEFEISAKLGKEVLFQN